MTLPGHVYLLGRSQRQHAGGRASKYDRLRRSSTIVVVPLTSAAKAASFTPPFLVQVLAREAGLPHDGWAKCDQPITLPTTLLGPKAGRLDPAALERVDAALRFVLGF